jgi:glyoxylase-like metal-dependent hydrolase (beta-lactamase superfamily II)
MFVSEGNLSIRPIISRMFAENCYLISREGKSRCIVVDPGLDDEKIIAAITENRLQPEAILLTHGHADHIAGVDAIKRCWPDCPIIIGEGDAPKLLDPELNLSTRYSFEITSPEADQLVQEGDRLHLAGIEWEVFDTPGHSAGHVIYLYKGSSPWLVVGGDVLFREGIGRSDFPDGDYEQLVESIETKLFTLPDDTVVLPGHGPATTIGHERQHNPFIPGRM